MNNNKGENMKRKLFPFLLACVLSLVVVCCISQESQELEGTQWDLDSYMDKEGTLVTILPNTEITAKFQGGIVNGSSGCNSYTGAYGYKDNTIMIDTLAVTEMYCAEPEGIMEQEYDYLTALRLAKNFKIKGSTLEMTNADGTVILVFTAV